MRDHDLFEPGAPLPDDLEPLQRRLARLPTPPEPDWSVVGRQRRARTPAPWLAAAAAISLVAFAAWFAMRDAWQVEAVSGSPQVRGLAFGRRLPRGGTLATDAGSTARLHVEGLGEVELAPDGELRRVGGRGDERRLALDHGSLRARINAPPVWFVVETRSAVATDLGCEYTLDIARDGSGRLAVMTGRVAFTDRGHESFVPAGLWCPVTAAGVGVPRRDYASEQFLAALARYDAQPREPAALDSVLEAATAVDAITLWHLLPRVPAADRGRVASRMAALIELPAEVSQDRIVSLDRAALDAWWNALGFGDVREWRAWEAGTESPVSKPG
jgi:hypothetical protein